MLLPKFYIVLRARKSLKKHFHSHTQHGESGLTGYYKAFIKTGYPVAHCCHYETCEGCGKMIPI